MEREITLAATRALFAHHLLDGRGAEQCVSLGSISLRPHQQSAIGRATAAIGEFGGALLADHVGTGKTYVALALTEAYEDTMVVAPAVLKDMWTAAASNAKVPITFISTESLSRAPDSAGQRRTPQGMAFIIVDEAQHFRNRATRRFASLARICSGRRVLLLSATPVHNRRRDLECLLSLFVGSRAANLTVAELGRVVIRRNRDQIGVDAAMPTVESPQWCNLSHDNEFPRLLLSLPPPLKPRNGGDGGALVVHSLIRQWTSSDAALYRALVRRLQKATALVSALERGSYPSESELTSWICGDDCVQLGFAEILAPRDSRSSTLLPIVRDHMAAIHALTQRLRVSRQRDEERADIIRSLRRKHSGIPIVAFSQYAETVEALFDLLAPDGFVALLTGGEARVYGGPLSRAEAIGRFAPHASGLIRPRPSDAVTLLLTTDILSEGVNLQDAGVVIHLDLPWTPARMEQRLGRVARMGSPHSRVFSYVLRPPASADVLIRTERILRKKMISAGVVTDGLQSVLPDSFPRRSGSVPEIVEDLRSILREWVGEPPEIAAMEIVASAVVAPVDGFVALCRSDGRYRMIAGDSGGVTDESDRVLKMLRLGNGEESEINSMAMKNAVDTANRYLTAARAVGTSQSQAHQRQSARRVALRRIARIASHARPHERSRIAQESSRARQTVLGRLSAGQETQLAGLSDQCIADCDWLREVAALSPVAQTTVESDEIVAMILFQPGERRE
jgi:superfamily II DNA or RNA helicase